MTYRRISLRVVWTAHEEKGIYSVFLRLLAGHAKYACAWGSRHCGTGAEVAVMFPLTGPKKRGRRERDAGSTTTVVMLEFGGRRKAVVGRDVGVGVGVSYGDKVGGSVDSGFAARSPICWRSDGIRPCRVRGGGHDDLIGMVGDTARSSPTMTEVWRSKREPVTSLGSRARRATLRMHFL